MCHDTQIDPSLDARFYREMDRLIREVCAHPERYRRFDPPFRRRFSADFPYAIVYVENIDQDSQANDHRSAQWKRRP